MNFFSVSLIECGRFQQKRIDLINKSLFCLIHGYLVLDYGKFIKLIAAHPAVKSPVFFALDNGTTVTTKCGSLCRWLDQLIFAEIKKKERNNFVKLIP